MEDKSPYKKIFDQEHYQVAYKVLWTDILKPTSSENSLKLTIFGQNQYNPSLTSRDTRKDSQNSSVTKIFSVGFTHNAER